jgi:hypothetical protein
MRRSRSQLTQKKKKKTRPREEEETTKRITLFRVYLECNNCSIKSQEHVNWILFLSQNRSREDENESDRARPICMESKEKAEANGSAHGRERARTGPSGGTSSSHKCVYTGSAKITNLPIHTRFLEHIKFKPITVRHISWDMGHVGVRCPCFGEWIDATCELSQAKIWISTGRTEQWPLVRRIVRND